MRVESIAERSPLSILQYFKSILVYKNSGEILDKLKVRDFNTTSLSTYNSFTLDTT